MTTERKVIVYIASSLDGYIAKPNDDLAFLDRVQKEGEDYGYADFMASVDTVIQGRKTYEWVLKHVPDFVHADKESYIITRSPRESIGKTSFYTGDLKALVSKLKQQTGKNIFVDGGAEVVNALMQEGLIDEFIVSFIPVMLGEGTKLFKDGRPEQVLKFVSAKTFDTGLVQLHYHTF